MDFLCTKILLSLLAIAGELKYGEGKRERVESPNSRDRLNVQIEVPKVVKVGDTAVLKCTYELGGDSLYTMKWYKGNHEFYRYTPKESPPIKTFPIPGLAIDLSLSNATHLTLKQADLNLTSRYTCEVTTDFPDFIAGIKSASLYVIAYPEKKPEITISHKRRYAVGDHLEANCTSYRSKPAANLTWLINDKRVHSKYQIPPEHKYKDSDRESTKLSIRFEVEQSHFTNGQLKLSCLAEIQDHYHQTSEVIIYEEDRPKISSVVESYSSAGTGSNNAATKQGSSSASSTRDFSSSTQVLLTFFIIIGCFQSFSSMVLNLCCCEKSSTRKSTKFSSAMSLGVLMR